MVLDSAFDSAMPTADDAPRVDLQRVLAGLRHLTGSTEPGRVFAELAAVCVPALCDEMIVDIEEAGGNAPPASWRTHRPPSRWGPPWVGCNESQRPPAFSWPSIT
jgi:hypothetical protein